MAKNIIFYFSGTGNCLAAAKLFAQRLGDCEVVFMKGGFTPAAHYERMGFVLPCYAGGAPKPALQFLRRLPLTGGSAGYVFSVVTCNVIGGDTSFMLDRALRRKGLRLHYSRTVRMVRNYVINYSIPENPDEVLRAADPELRAAAAEIEQKRKTDPPRWHPHYTVFYRMGSIFFYMQEKRMFASDACRGCGLCAELCPVGNIAMKNGKPEFLHKNCTNCLACLHWCPNAAIDCGKRTQQRGRYHHPDIKPGELK